MPSRLRPTETPLRLQSGTFVSHCYRLVRLTIDDAEKLVDSPVSLQIVGRKLEEEKVIEITKVVVKALGDAA